MGMSFLEDVHTECLCLRESKSGVSCLLLKLQMTFDGAHTVANLKIIDM